jgi:choline dehydrogenase
MSAVVLGDAYDYIVVGAGTAGCLLANRLSADVSKRVLLLEAGGNDNYIWIKIPVGYLYCIGNPRTDWMYNTQPEAGLAGRSIRYPRGKVIGGCSSINGMIYMRGQATDYARWTALGNEGWSWDEVLPYFLKHEDHHSGVSSILHRSGGEWRVQKQRLSWEILDAFRKAAEQTGIAPVEDFNGGDNAGCGYFEVNQSQGVRWNSARAFLDQIKGRPNLTILTHAHVSKLALDTRDVLRPEVTGVEFVRDGVKSMAKLKMPGASELVLAAGAIGSVQILEMSGIGRPQVLAAAGVKVVLPEEGVGENLQDHLQLRTIFKVSNVLTLNKMANSLIGKAQIGWEYLLKRTGPMSMAPSQLGAFVKSDPSVSSPDLQYHVQPLSLDKFGEPLHSFAAMTASVCNLRPFSRGSVHIKTGNFEDSPAIRPEFLSDDRDLAVAANAIRITRKIMAAPALQQYSPSEYLPGASIQSEQDLQQAARQIGTTIFHPVGTLKMGVGSDASSFVNARLEAHRVAGLRVADASVMPLITSGNTNSPTLMIAERAAHWMTNRR